MGHEKPGKLWNFMVGQGKAWNISYVMAKLHGKLEKAVESHEI